MFNQEVDKTITSLLTSFISGSGMIENALQQANRKDVLDDLEQRLSQWVYDIYKNQYGQFMAGYQQGDPSTRLVLLQPFGSYFLQTHSTSSDIDTVIFFPSYVKVDTFLECITAQFNTIPGVTHAQYIKTKRPLVSVSYHGVQVDLQPAVLQMPTVSRTINWLDPHVLDQVNLRYWGAVAAITTNVKIKDMMVKANQFPIFQQLVRLLKYAAEKLMISKNRIGYLGGVNISILAANIIYISKQRLSLCEYLYQFFNYYSQYDFSKPLLLNNESEYHNDKSPMQIVTLTKPEVNSTAKVTSSTCKVIVNQFKNCKQAMEYLFRLVNACHLDKVGKLLLKPAICDMIFDKLKPNAIDEGQAQIKTYSLEPYSSYFFKNKDLNGGIMSITLSSPQQDIREQARDKLEPLLVTLFNKLEKIKLEIVGSNANIEFIQPNPEWYDNGASVSFYVGISKTSGEKEWLAQKLLEVIRQFKIKIRDCMEKESTEIGMVFCNMGISIQSGKSVLKQIMKERKQQAAGEIAK